MTIFIVQWLFGFGGVFVDMGVKDFAGGIVVHTTAGLAALVIAYYSVKEEHLQAIPTLHIAQS